MLICYSKSHPDMARLDVIIDDNVLQELRIKAIKKFGGKKGDLSKAVEEAIRLWLESPN